MALTFLKNAVACTDRDVHLVESYPETGRIEVCHNSSWGTICTNTWDDLDASVACRHFGYSPFGLTIKQLALASLVLKMLLY